MVNEFGSLKLKLEAEWNRPGVRCTDHLTQWAVAYSGSTGPRGRDDSGSKEYGWKSYLTGLFYRRGRKVSVRSLKSGAPRGSGRARKASAAVSGLSGAPSLPLG